MSSSSEESGFKELILCIGMYTVLLVTYLESEVPLDVVSEVVVLSELAIIMTEIPLISTTTTIITIMM